MTVKSLLSIEVVKENRTYKFYIPAGAPYGETYDALFTCLENVAEMQKLSIEQLKKQNPIAQASTPTEVASAPVQ